MNSSEIDSVALVHIGYVDEEFPEFEKNLQDLIRSVRETGANVIFFDEPNIFPQTEHERMLMIQIAACKILGTFAHVAYQEAIEHIHRPQESKDIIHEMWESGGLAGMLAGRDGKKKEPIQKDPYGDASLKSFIYRSVFSRGPTGVYYLELCFRWVMPFIEMHFPEYLRDDITEARAKDLQKKLYDNFDSWVPRLMAHLQSEHRAKFEEPFLPVSSFARKEPFNSERRERIHSYAREHLGNSRVHARYMEDAQQYREWSNFYEGKMQGKIFPHELDEEYEPDEREQFGSYQQEYYRIQRDLNRLRHTQWLHALGSLLPLKDEIHMHAGGEYGEECVQTFCSIARDDFGVQHISTSKKTEI